MATIRNREQELRRQISYHKALKKRVYENADKKAQEYEEKIARLQRELEATPEYQLAEAKRILAEAEARSKSLGVNV